MVHCVSFWSFFFSVCYGSIGIYQCLLNYDTFNCPWFYFQIFIIMHKTAKNSLTCVTSCTDALICLWYCRERNYCNIEYAYVQPYSNLILFHLSCPGVIKGCNNCYNSGRKKKKKTVVVAEPTSLELLYLLLFRTLQKFHTHIGK